MSMAGCKVYYGLVNEGSTCYLNAVLQTLFMTKEFREHVKSVSSGDNFIRELKKLFNKLETEKKPVSAAEVRKSLGIPDDKVDEPRDAAEYLQKILNKTPGPSEFFKGTMTKKACVPCTDKLRKEKKQETREAFLSLPVSLKGYQDVEVAVKAYLDQTCEKCQTYCHACKKTTDWKSEMINFPKLLIVQLSKSDDQKVIIRPQIKVSSLTYDLYAIVNYEVKDGRRHYYADIECECRSDWRRFNDCSVSEIPSVESSTLWSSEAYLLVYRRRE